MGRAATPNRTRRPAPPDDDDERIDKLSLNAVACRVDAHDWPKLTAVEYVHIEDHNDGSVKVGERRFRCRVCGLVKFEVYTAPYPGATPYFSAGPYYRYKDVPDYLIVNDPDRPRRRLTKDDFRRAYFARTNPWSSEPPRATAKKSTRRRTTV